MKNNSFILLKEEKERIKKLHEATAAASSGSYNQPMAFTEPVEMEIETTFIDGDNIQDGSEEITLDIEDIAEFLAVTEDDDRKRMRKLHKESSVIKEQVAYTPECGGIEKDPKTNSRIWYPCEAAMLYQYPNANDINQAKEIYAQGYRNNVINGDWDRKGWIDEYINGEWQDSWDLCDDCPDGDSEWNTDIRKVTPNPNEREVTNEY